MLIKSIVLLISIASLFGCTPPQEEAPQSSDLDYGCIHLDQSIEQLEDKPHEVWQTGGQPSPIDN